MYKYNKCNQSEILRLYPPITIPCCPKIVGQGSAIPESARMASEVCGISYVNQSTIKNPTGTPLIVVQVGTTAASITTQERANNIINAANDPYNPATRFSQYFPPEPIPYVAPVCIRIPNNEAKPSTTPCIPLQRYESTAESLAKQNSN